MLCCHLLDKDVVEIYAPCVLLIINWNRNGSTEQYYILQLLPLTCPNKEVLVRTRDEKKAVAAKLTASICRNMQCHASQRREGREKDARRRHALHYASSVSAKKIRRRHLASADIDFRASEVLAVATLLDVTLQMLVYPWPVCHKRW
jgi:hypothetical protein